MPGAPQKVITVEEYLSFRRRSRRQCRRCPYFQSVLSATSCMFLAVNGPDLMECSASMFSVSHYHLTHFRDDVLGVRGHRKCCREGRAALPKRRSCCKPSAFMLFVSLSSESLLLSLLAKPFAELFCEFPARLWFAWSSSSTCNFRRMRPRHQIIKPIAMASMRSIGI